MDTVHPKEIVFAVTLTAFLLLSIGEMLDALGNMHVNFHAYLLMYSIIVTTTIR